MRYVHTFHAYAVATMIQRIAWHRLSAELHKSAVLVHVAVPHVHGYVLLTVDPSSTVHGAI